MKLQKNSIEYGGFEGVGKAGSSFELEPNCRTEEWTYLKDSSRALTAGRSDTLVKI